MRTATMDRRAAVKLMMPRTVAAEVLAKHINEAQAIRAQKIRSASALDKAREFRIDWTSRTIDMLREMFDDKSVADECFSYAGKILPEFAEVNSFVEQFYDQMDFHIRHLRALLKMLTKKPIATVLKEEESKPANHRSNGNGNGHASHESEAQSTVPVVASVAPVRAMGNGSNKPASPVVEIRATTSSSSRTLGLLILHGVLDSSVNGVREFLEGLGLSLMQVALSDEGEGITEALEQHRNADFALLITGEADCDESLCFEMGYCIGRLGLGRVCILRTTPAEPTTDNHGILNLPLDTGGGWQLHLARHLKKAGVRLDLNKLC